MVYFCLAELKTEGDNEERGCDQGKERDKEGDRDGDEERGACGGLGPESRKDTTVDMIIEDTAPNTTDLPASLELRITMATSMDNNNSVRFEFEITNKSKNTESYLSNFQLFSMGLVIYNCKIVIINGTVKQWYSGYVAVLKMQKLQALWCHLKTKEKNGTELEMKEKTFMEMIKKTLFLDFIEYSNGEPIQPQAQPNTDSHFINIGALSCVFKLAVGAIVARLGINYTRLSFVPGEFTSLRPVLIGIVPSMDLSAIFSFLHWPDSALKTAQHLYNNGYYCTDFTRGIVMCLTCGKSLTVRYDGEQNIAVCCSPTRVLSFEGPISVAEMSKLLSLMMMSLESLGPSNAVPLRDNYLSSYSSVDIDHERFIDSGLHPTEDAGTFVCSSCRVRLGNWQESHDPVLRHAAVSLYCSHILRRYGPAFIYFVRENLLQARITLTGYLGHDVIKYPEYRLRSARESTWANNSLNTDGRMSEAGYFLEGSFCVTFCCGIRLADIRESDDPWTVHFDKQPNCPFILESRPEFFAIRAGSCGLTEDQMRQFALPTEQDIGTTNDVPQLRIEGVLDGIDSSSFTEGETVDIFQDPPQEQDQSDEELVRICEENEAQRRILLCMICEENYRDVAFLPCGHICCCSECAPAYIKCPSCQIFISGNVVMFLS
ncbi:uncharacterized protein [Argopecten irradians]|uniref:uncharacterized protein isoform X2 n=1 Tax=Argopecten irradians TaxID=31199 RepID=UPI00371E7ACC